MSLGHGGGGRARGLRRTTDGRNEELLHGGDSDGIESGSSFCVPVGGGRREVTL